ncbi:MAG: T9SS type A sorting domain-containing protein [Balneolales bacterium]
MINFTNKNTEIQKRKEKRFQLGYYTWITMRFFLVCCLMVSVSTLMVQDLIAVQKDATPKHRATLIDIEGNIITPDHSKYAQITDEHEGISVHEDDSLALVAVYHAMNGDDWRDNTGWLTEKVEFWPGVNTVEEVNPDEWRVTQFVTIRENMTVPGVIPPDIENMQYLERFRVQDDLLSGSIPPEFGNIPTFEFLVPQNNLLTGEIPWRELGQLEHFWFLMPRFNFLSGEIPSWIGEDDEDGNPYFPVIERLMISGNQFEGHLPASLANRATLERLTVDDNHLTGPIPDLSSLENLNFFFINNNDFESGPIPEMIREWDQIERISLANTNRTGVIPEWFGELTSLERLMGGGIGGEDDIGGEIPESMQFLPNLWDFTLSGGNWSGEIPDWIADLPSLEIVTFNDVAWTGSLPESFGDASDMRRIYITGSEIEGNIPEVWQNLTRMEIIDLSNNSNMELGEIPDWMAQNWTELEHVDLSNTGVTGEIPDNFADLTGLERLILKDNPQLIGDLPNWISTSNLRQLSLSNSGFNISEIPEWIDNWDRLDALELGGYGIEGSIPDWLGNENLAPTLTVLALDNNNFSGEIPSSLGNLFLLDSLNLANNDLSGDIPVMAFNEMGKPTPAFSVTEAVVLSGNEELTGEMPLFEDATFMRVIEFDGTNICETTGFDARAVDIEEAATAPHPDAYFSVNGSGLSCQDVSSTIMTDIPERVQLKNNYPNPFNPQTTIAYSVPNEMHVTLRVYNILGEQVATLVNEHKTAGSYEVNFDGSNLSSGNYVYRLETDEVMMTNKMLLIK